MTTLMIHETAIRQNVREIRTRTDKRIIAVVKENGYGIGLKNAYEILHSSKIDFYAVSSPGEAYTLRKLGCKDDILLLTPELSVEECSHLLIQNIIFSLGSYEQADILKEASAHTKIIPRVHLALDTGLGRYGFPWDEPETIRLCTSGARIEGCYTHFATNGSRFKKNVRLQLHNYEKALHVLTSMGISYGMTHASASKSFCEFGDLGFDAIRLGSLLLGCIHGENAFRRAVWLESPVYITSIQKRGKQIGYDGKLKLKRDTKVGIVQAGYSDGVFIGSQDGEMSIFIQFLSILKNLVTYRTRRKYVRIDDIPVPVLGKIGLNHLLVDLTDGGYLIGDQVRIEVNPLFVPQKVERVLIASEELELSKSRWLLFSAQTGLIAPEAFSHSDVLKHNLNI